MLQTILNYTIFITKFFCLSGICLMLFACNPQQHTVEKSNESITISKATLIVLGTLQDGGSPHVGCKKTCCEKLFTHPDPERKVVCLGLIDPTNKQTWLLEATPDIATQMKELKLVSGFSDNETPNGIFLSHAHIGHYAGLMYLGREAMNAKNVPVYAMPRMKQFVENNGPWNQLVTLANIELKALNENEAKILSSNFTITPFTVPHRDEYSETVGYTIQGPTKKALFIPDIDKWEKWNKNILNEIQKVDYAFIDATFFNGEEINNRNIKEIPHPFVVESMTLFKSLSAKEKSKIYFIHFNHTNPLLIGDSESAKEVKKAGFNIATKGMTYEM